MSSTLKDARWQLAEEMATEDGFDFYEMDYIDKTDYLNAAEDRLLGQPQEFINRLAARFNERSGNG